MSNEDLWRGYLGSLGWTPEQIRRLHFTRWLTRRGRLSS